MVSKLLIKKVLDDTKSFKSITNKKERKDIGTEMIPVSIKFKEDNLWLKGFGVRNIK